MSLYTRSPKNKMPRNFLQKRFSSKSQSSRELKIRNWELRMRNKFTPVKTSKRQKKSSKIWLQRQLNDPYVKTAQMLGYRSRAAFKLLEIDKKFSLLKKSKNIIDLGAAPGGWSQIVAQNVKDANILAIDVLDMPPISGVDFIKLDFLHEDAKEIIPIIIKKKWGVNHVDLVLSDMASNSCGDAKTDHLRIINMLEEALDFAIKILAPNGSFVGKILQGGTSGELLQKFKKNFTMVKHFKPNSSRKESAENYIIAIGFGNPIK